MCAFSFLRGILFDVVCLSEFCGQLAVLHVVSFWFVMLSRVDSMATHGDSEFHCTPIGEQCEWPGDAAKPVSFDVYIQVIIGTGGHSGAGPRELLNWRTFEHRVLTNSRSRRDEMIADSTCYVHSREK